MEEGFVSEVTNIPHHQVHYVSNMENDTTEACFVEGNTNNTNTNTNNIINSSNYDVFEVSMFSSSDSQYYCYYLLDTMPMPGPTWSTTTTPSVFSDPSSSSSSQQIEGSLGLLEMGFLEDDLDCNVMNNEEIFLDHYPFVDDAMDLSCCCCCPDDWLVVPTLEKDFGDIVDIVDIVMP